MAEEGERGQRTEEPTPRRLAEARRRGKIAFSRELVEAATFAAAFAAMVVAAPGWISRLRHYLAFELQHAAAGGSMAMSLVRGVGVLVLLLTAPLSVALAVGICVSLAQTRGLLTLEPVKPDLARLSPGSYVRRVFSMRAAAEIARGVLKLLLALVVAGSVLWSWRRDVASLSGRPSSFGVAAFGELALRLGVRMCLLLIVLGALEYWIAARRVRRELAMTRHELRRERRESEGDPQHRAERQRMHRDLTQQRMLADVRKADFVVVNPDHLAIAVRYDRDGQRAPVVVAKGERLLAQRIRQAAREAGVPVFRDVTLARSLNAVEEGDEIPEFLYEAVAEMLRAVYALDCSHDGTQTHTTPAAEHEASQSRVAPQLFGNDADWKRA